MTRIELLYDHYTFEGQGYEDRSRTFNTIIEKKEDLVEVLGKLYVATAPVADKAFALLTVPASS